MNKINLRMHDIPANLKNTSLAIGFFDGLHLGHQELIRQTLSSPYDSAILTFTTELKDKVQTKTKTLLLTEEEKEDMLQRLGVDFEYVLPFDQETMTTSVAGFLDFLRKLHCKEIVVGDDFTFGLNASGKAEDLRSLKDFGIEVNIITLKEYEGQKVSSTRIKNLLVQGDITTANQLLGYSYFYQGTVIHGFHNGSALGFPTANMEFPKEKVVLPTGVYKTVSIIDGISYPSMTNIGNHPTIDKLNNNIVETYVLDQDLDLYGKTIQIDFIKKLRDQVRFQNVKELVAQLNKDKERCREEYDNVSDSQNPLSD